MPSYQPTFPLIPKRRLVGLAFGTMLSTRRGPGSDVAGSRPYRPGDDVKEIDWKASAKLSLATGKDEFVVREHYAEEAPRVVVLCDRRPSMSVFPPEWPWLSKPLALAGASKLVVASSIAARGLVGYLEHAGDDPFWHPPRSEHVLPSLDPERPFTAPADALVRGLEYLFRQRRDLPAGTFVFVLSDFLAPPPRDTWMRALERRWEVVPVVLQDPVWERSFPDVSGVVVPLVDVESGRVRQAGLTAGEAARRRAENERRWEELVRELRSLDLEPVVVGSQEPRDILFSFLKWADERVLARGLAW